ncbi:hypothetical protein MPRG_62960 (plasmid) [Mycobacterium paragordonae]|uniref:Uncharacterized protein n=1 Tax=Mycobacterium paragordonae TaxID=1389713 RepID=A0ABQ1CFK2_9MYCO|nr:hypothetical protein MPRG_62960 [Mycobacterium paragordonae]
MIGGPAPALEPYYPVPGWLRSLPQQGMSGAGMAFSDKQCTRTSLDTTRRRVAWLLSCGNQSQDAVGQTRAAGGEVFVP